MPNDNLMFPPRFVGYGAYNLCFDSQLGKTSSTGKDFFQYIHERWPAINLVRVICFRKATVEGLPPVTYDSAGVPNGRTQPLFKRDKTLNPKFLDNLLALVQRAKEFDFWVQVCLFHVHAVKAFSDGSFEEPENVPKILDPKDAGMGSNNCQRLTNFFNIGDTAVAKERFKLQTGIVYAIASKLRWETNVLFEIANEVRIQGCSAADNSARNCKIVPWLNSLSESILSAIFWDHEPDCTSTGIENEAVTFSRQRPVQGCSEPRFIPSYYDFHAGQWKASDDVNTYTAGIEAAKQRVLAYRGAPADSPRASLIINDDGLNWDENTVEEKKANAARIKKWATVAFQKGLSYASKQQYPPAEPFDTYALNALQAAHNAAPVPQ